MVPLLVGHSVQLQLSFVRPTKIAETVVEQTRPCDRYVASRGTDWLPARASRSVSWAGHAAMAGDKKVKRLLCDGTIGTLRVTLRSTILRSSQYMRGIQLRGHIYWVISDAMSSPRRTQVYLALLGRSRGLFWFVARAARQKFPYRELW